MTFLKSHCLACDRWIDPEDIIFGCCAYCLEERANNAAYNFRPIGPKQQFPRCYECDNEIHLVGMKTWDRLGKSWKLLCTKCGEHQVTTDRQYTDSAWGRELKIK